MKYYSDIQETGNGYFIVSEKKRVLSINKMVRYRVNLPNDADYSEHIGPYTVEEKVGRSWVKIGVLSPLHRNERKQAHSNRVDKQKNPVVKKSSMEKHRIDITKTLDESTQRNESYAKQETSTASKIIYDQLGGNNFMIKIGAKRIIEGRATLAFKIKKNRNDISHINIILNELDQYDIEFLKVKNYEVNTLKELYNIHPKDLQETISEETGIVFNL
jgi:hypothetical protein